MGPLWNIALGLGLGAYAVWDRFATGRRRTDLATRNGHVPLPLAPEAGELRANGRGEVPGGPEAPRAGVRPRILIHGVSVGEVNAVAPLVEALSAQDSGAGPPGNGAGGVAPLVMVSSATETGFARATDVHGGERPVVRYPLDFTWMVRRFLDRTEPDVVVLAEQELWPAFLTACRKRRLPVCLVNARMSDGSFRRYRRLGRLTRWMFEGLDLVVCQSEAYREQLVALGADPDRTVVTGSLKWDAAVSGGDPDRARALGRSLGVDPDRPLVVAGSTGPGEEARLLSALPPGVQLLFAPRRPERWDEVADLVPGMPRRSRAGEGGEGGAEETSCRVFLLDTIGELTDAYLLADAVFVGRSLFPQGGSNPLESVALGKPTVMGPHGDNFRDVIERLVAGGGLVVSQRPMEVIGRWLADRTAAEAVAEAGLAAVAANRGSARATATLILERLDR